MTNPEDAQKIPARPTPVTPILEKESTPSPTNNPRIPNILWAIIISTAIYCIAIFVYLFITRDGRSEISSLKPNEIGDLLAGVFAPLAFLWLVVAIFIQKDELRAQLTEYQESVRMSQKQLALSMNALERSNIIHKFNVISAKCVYLSKILFPDATNIEDLLFRDQHDACISEFNDLLLNVIDTQDGIKSDALYFHDILMDNKESVLHHMRIIIITIDEILRRHREQREADIESRIFSSNAKELRLHIEILISCIEEN